MSAQTLITELAAKGIRIESRPGGTLYLAPKSKLTSELVQQIRQHKPALIAYLIGDTNGHRPASTSSVIPDARHPLILEAIRAKIEAIEPEARAKGWPAELLWSRVYWDLPRGLAAVLDPEDEITEVTSDIIEIVRMRRNVLRFRRTNA